ncbi:hypothetical protein BDY24DRAFT_399171 [Mrakia frigida]|uniref:uncharacterized protein n=1 Tax=Mrakia frigida TaxID=29902 RepID=UPI003FCC17E6
MSSTRRPSSALSSFLEHSSFTASPSNSQSSSSSRTAARSSSSSSKGSPLVTKEKKGKEKGREQEEQRGGTRIEVNLNFPTSNVLQMVGGLSTQSTYSLPLEVILTVLPLSHSSSASSSTSSSFWHSTSSKASRDSSCIVRAIDLTYEARTEFYDHTAYSSLRIHHQTHRIVLPTPLVIPFSSTTPSESSYSIPLDVLRLPGWLPSTFYLPFATLTSSVSATVQVVNVSSASSSSSSWLARAGTGGAPTEGKMRFSSSGEREVVVERLRVPRAICSMESRRDRDLVDESGFSMRHFSLKAEAESPIDCVISVSEFLPFDSPSFEFSIRVRSRPGWIESGGGALSLVALEFAVEQVEKYRSTPSGTFLSTYPIPDEQPLTGHPLRQQSSLHTLSDLGVFPSAPHKSTRVTSLFQAEGGGARTIAFEGEEGELTGKWKKLDLRAEKPRYVVGKNGQSRKGERRVIPAMATPFLKVGHGLKIRILCRNENSPSDTVILLNSPLRFVATPGTIPPLSSSSSSSSSSSQTRQPRTPLPSSAHVLPSTSLPPYVTLFYESGTAREDPEPLPLYGSTNSPPTSPPPLFSPNPLDSTASSDDTPVALDPVVVMLEQREIQERVHGVRRGGSGGGGTTSLGRDDDDLDSEEIEELDDFVEVGGSSSTRTRDRRRPRLGRAGSSSRTNSGDTLSSMGRPSFSSSIRPGTPPTTTEDLSTDDPHPPHSHHQPHRLSATSWRPPNRLPPPSRSASASASALTSTSTSASPFLHRSSSLGIISNDISIPHSPSSSSSIANLSPSSSHSLLAEPPLPSSPKLSTIQPSLSLSQHNRTPSYTHTHVRKTSESEQHHRGRTSTIASSPPPSSFSARSFDGSGGSGTSTRAPSRDSSADGSVLGHGELELGFRKREAGDGLGREQEEEEMDGTGRE